VRGAPVLLVLCLLTAGMLFAGAPAHMLWQKRFTDLSGADVWVMGWIWAFINLATLIGSWVLPRFLDRLGREWALFGATLWRAATLGLAAAATGFWPAVAFYLLAEVSMGLTEPMLQAWMNERIPSAQRATVLSVRSMFATLGGSIGLASIGLVARDAGIPIAWAASALVLLLIAPGFVVLGRLHRARAALRVAA
jgi:MFS family permease